MERNGETALSVVFSSFNGEQTLGATLEAFTRLRPPEGGWKLIAVNNGSDDRTWEILQSFRSKLPMLILDVPQRGKNVALNEALKHIEGELIVFTDDDVVPKSDWLVQLSECAKQHPEISLFGGKIVPRWPKAPESWLNDSLPLGMLFAITAPNLESGPIDNDLVWGPNMAVRREVFDRGLKYNESVGPDGTNTYAMGSESEFTRRLAGIGVTAWHCSEAVVEHLIRPNQMTKTWVLQRFLRHGRSAYMVDHFPDEKTPRLFGVQRWIFSKIVLQCLKTARFKLLGQDDAAFKELAVLYHDRGKLFQALQLARSRHGAEKNHRRVPAMTKK